MTGHGNDEPQVPAVNLTEYAQTPFEERLLQLARALPGRKRDALLRLIEALHRL